MISSGPFFHSLIVQFSSVSSCLQGMSLLFPAPVQLSSVMTFRRTLPPVCSAVVKELLDVSAGVFWIIVLRVVGSLSAMNGTRETGCMCPYLCYSLCC